MNANPINPPEEIASLKAKIVELEAKVIKLTSELEAAKNAAKPSFKGRNREFGRDQQGGV
jgi:hypothetical protein